MLLDDPEEIEFSDNEEYIPVYTKHQKKTHFDGISIRSSMKQKELMGSLVTGANKPRAEVD